MKRARSGATPPATPPMAPADPRAAGLPIAAACIATLISAAAAGAEAPSPQPSVTVRRPAKWDAPADAAPAAPSASSEVRAEKRAVPNYDGREPAPPSAADVLLWIPRIALMPLYLVSEYVLRKPLGWLVSTLDQAGIQDLFGPQSNVIIFPTLVADFGFRTSIGVYFGLNDLGFEGHQQRARLAFGGLGFWKARLKERIVFDDGFQRIGLHGSYRERADDTFAGVGPNLTYDLDTVGRYRTRTVEGGIDYDWSLNRPTTLVAAAVVRDVTYRGDGVGGPALADQVDAGERALPDRFNEGYTTFHPELLLTLDTRSKLSDRRPFLRLETFASADISLRRPSSASWVNYGLEVGGGLELGAPLRRLSLSLASRFADPLGDEAVPFSALAEVGTNRHLRAFTGGALRGRSALMATAIYRWPIWVWLDGSFHLAMGNVFGEHLSDFNADKFRLSFGPGISTNAIDESMVFDVGLAFGTETFEQGTEITSTRIAFGLSEGF